MIAAWQSGPLEVQAVRDATGSLRGDTIAPRIAMRDGRPSQARHLYLTPAHIGIDSEGRTIALPGFEDGRTRSRIPVLPVNLYDLGVTAGEARGGRGAAPIPARMLVKLAGAPSAVVRHGERFVSYKITLGDLRNALYPPERLDGSSRVPPKVSRMWPRISAAIRVINRDAQIPVLDSMTGYGHYHQLLRISENFGRIDLNMPIHVVLDIPPEVEAECSCRSTSTSGVLSMRPRTGLSWDCRFCGMSRAAHTRQRRTAAGCEGPDWTHTIP